MLLNNYVRIAGCQGSRGSRRHRQAGQLAGVRPHVADPVPRGALRARAPRSRRVEHHPVAARGGRRPHERVRLQGAEPAATGQHHSGLAVRTEYDVRTATVMLIFDNSGPSRVQLTVRDGYTSRRTSVSVRGGQSAAKSWVVSRTRGWYDLVVPNAARKRYMFTLKTARTASAIPPRAG